MYLYYRPIITKKIQLNKLDSFIFSFGIK